MRTPEEQIRYAASITPSPRQLAWQQLEFYAFTHGIALLRLSIPTWTISTFCLRPHHKYNYPNWLTIIKLLLLDLFVKTLVSNSNRIIGSHIFGAIVTLCVAFRTEQNRL